jgi:hypothetical protein
MPPPELKKTLSPEQKKLLAIGSNPAQSISSTGRISPLSGQRFPLCRNH